MSTLRIYLTFAVLLVLGLALLWMALRRLLNKRIFNGTLYLLSSTTLIGAAAGGVLLLNNYLTYSHFTAEQPVATLSFEKLNAPQRYRVNILENTTPEKNNDYLLFGDEWQLDARILKWRGIATQMGFEPIYRLERLSGRYTDPQQESLAPRTVHALATGTRLELWTVVQYLRDWLPLLDTYYGNATYMPMADGAHYEVSILATGLIARPKNETAKTALENWK